MSCKTGSKQGKCRILENNRRRAKALVQSIMFVHVDKATHSSIKQPKDKIFPKFQFVCTIIGIPVIRSLPQLHFTGNFCIVCSTISPIIAESKPLLQNYISMRALCGSSMN